MTTIKGEAAGQVFEIDTSGLEDRLDKKSIERFEAFKKELENFKFPKRERGKGTIERPANEAKLLESLQHVKTRDIQEQWTIVIPNLTQYEVAGHLRDYVFVTDIIKGKVGDIAEIPYVKDLDFEVLSAVGSAFAAATTGLIATETTTLKEAGAYSDIAYEDIEKINQNLLDELNRTFAHAAVRAEDSQLIALLNARSTGSFAGQAGMTGTNIKAGSTVVFKSTYIPEAIGLMLQAGKEVHPGDCILAINPKAYADLLTELAGTSATAVAYARGDIITKGMVEDWLGIRIVVMGSTAKGKITTYASTSYECAYLFRAKRCLGLAPKRDILIETDRQIATRKLRIAASHTFGVVMLDPTEAVRINTGQILNLA